MCPSPDVNDYFYDQLSEYEFFYSLENLIEFIL